MFKKVLIVDDYDVVNEGVLTVLNTKGVINVEKAQYCDDAFLKLKKADLDKEPFDLLITDLSFKEDFHEGEILSGDELVIAVRGYGLTLPIIVYSMEDRLQRVRTLINKYNVNAYVCKGRRSSLELGQAILDIQDKKIFLSPQVQNALSPHASLEIQDYDINLINYLSQGLSQSDISTLLEQQNITPRSLSSIEKRLNKLKVDFKAKNVTHLVAIVKDLGLI
ncbi:response regulator [Formosa algae]|uniref:DNA-binding NarL/FixJ family response regulator n=1 Tax=Formosa algae TaxID=225843 RepID=A0A9X1CB07_9FLAO|nr:response regulator [Formosa algae]MBP1838715.1 DNA-binding NarL/FixJ family response regulator [Formosa algae]MDQ0335215.1 DNA-binding NarL/FixJ family response regulator [Formosa algae]OEI81649.1 transcriptional regulator [Formosa algae]